MEIMEEILKLFLQENKVISIFNLSNKKIELELNSANLKGIYNSVFTNDEKIFNENEILELDPWQFYIYTNKN